MSDLARRIMQRREELGLTSEEVARRAGFDPGYLEYFEQSPIAVLSSTALVRLSQALETTPRSLAGGDVTRPPGLARAGLHPVIETLTEDQCLGHLVAGGIGRIVFCSEAVPVALPVNFRFVDGHVVFRTQASTAESVSASGTVSFEVDRIDEAMSEGWSVLVTGTAHQVVGAEEISRLKAADIEPWAGGEREIFVRLDAREVSGRAILEAH
jgi:nitroimidazol reductase NimA-like FMN-containing flavoprotein (pyridoxamine 5'-phosphate oxidase superfamily)